MLPTFLNIAERSWHGSKQSLLSIDIAPLTPHTGRVTVVEHGPRLAGREDADVARKASDSTSDGMAPMLHHLAHAGLALGIVSTNSEANVRTVLGPAAELIDHFDCGDGIFRKRFGLRRLLRRSRVGRSRALYIGDEIRDYRAARAAGVAFGAVG